MPNAVQFRASEIAPASSVALLPPSSSPTDLKALIMPVMVPMRPAITAKLASIARYGVRALILGSSRRAASSIAAWTSSSLLLNFMRPAWTMRVIGVGLPEHTLMAPWTLPAMTWLFSRARSLSLSTEALNR
jgi:hypothetical protein